MKTPPEASVPVLKWSSKPADHNANRIRNNQRRHRARVKEHVQDLEKRLAETSARLDAALQTISHLAEEVAVLRGRDVSAPPPPPPPPSTVTATVPHIGIPTGDPDICQEDAPTTQTPVLESPSMAGAVPFQAEAGDTADCDCDGAPRPAPGESTLPCSSAFRIIEQQNFSGVEVTTIRAWLGPGFRKALRPGEACRVETNRVYELLDHITSSS